MPVGKGAEANALRYLFGRGWRYSAGHRGKIVAFWAMFIIAESVHVFVQPLVWAEVMNVIQREGVHEGNLTKLSGLLALALVTTLTFWSLHGPARLLERTNAFRVRMKYREHLLQGVMTLPMDWHVNHHSGDTIDKIEKGTNALFSFMEDSFEIIYAIVQLVGSLAMLAYFSPSAIGIVLGMMCVAAWIIVRFDQVLLEQYTRLNRSENRISESVFDAVSNITTIIILRVEKLVFRAIMRKVEEPLDLFCHNNRLNELKWFLTNACSRSMIVVAIGVYFYRHVGTAQGVLVGEVYLLIQYLENIGDLFFRFAGMYGDIVKRKAKVMNSEELTEDFRGESFSNHVLPEGWRELTVERLSFSYHSEESGDLHLEDVSLAIARGERIALVGASGSGKTTLLKLMRDLYHPRSLALAVDGRPIPHGFEGIARAISLVPQNPEIFATTILENITLGAEYDPEFVRRFTDMACFTEVVATLPRGLDSSIKEKGVNLSGGQQQRLALARGLLACHDKDIVLLDEPTSSLDTLNEARIYGNIFREFRGKTIISSIHRLHLLPLFDRIYVFRGGRIASSGSLQEVLSGCAEFRSIWEQYRECERHVAG